MKETGFEQWWAAWPKNITAGYQRKGGKSKCLQAWIKGLYWTQADTIIKHTEWMKTTPDWLKDRGAFIPMPITYLNQQRWDGAEIAPERTEPPKAYQVSDEHIARAVRPSDEFFAQLRRKALDKTL